MLANNFRDHFVTKSDWQIVVIRDKGRPLNRELMGAAHTPVE